MVRDNNHGGGCSITMKPYRSLPDVLYEMVDDPSTDSIVSWSESGKSFIVWNQSEFSNDFLPRHSLSKDMSVLANMLRYFGFRKVDSDHWEYANRDFVRGKHERTEKIQKRFLAKLPPDTFVFKKEAEDFKVIKKTRALHIKERALVKNLSNLTL